MHLSAHPPRQVRAKKKPRTASRPTLRASQIKVNVFTAGWKNIAACNGFKDCPALVFQGPPTNAAFRDALRDNGNHYDFVFPTLHMHDPQANCKHLGLHPEVALPPGP